MMRRTEMMNNFHIRVVDYIHIRTLRHPGNHISSHTDTISVRALDERSSVIVPINDHESTVMIHLDSKEVWGRTNGQKAQTR